MNNQTNSSPQVGQLVPASDVSLQISIPSFASPSPFLTPKFHLNVGQDGKAILPNTMDVLTCMEGEGRFYVSGPIANNLEYAVTVEGVGEGILKRQVYGENVRRVEVGGGKAGQVQGTLFLPEVAGPGVLCLAGAGGARVGFKEYLLEVMVNFLTRKTLQHFWLAKASPPLLLLILGHQVYPGLSSCLFYGR